MTYRAASNGVSNLFSVASEGGPVTSLSSPQVTSFGTEISPDSARLIYFSDRDSAPQLDLFSVPLTGGPAIKLNDPLPSGGAIQRGSNEKRVTADSARVVYRGSQITPGDTELFSVPIAGGKVTRLNTDLPQNGDVNEFLLSADGARVVYRADQVERNVQELFSVPVAGGVPTKLNPIPVDGGDVSWFETSPAGDRVAFVGDVETNGSRELFSVPIDGGPAVRLSLPGNNSGLFSEDSFGFSPDGRWIFFLADHETPGVRELYMVFAAGGSVTKISAPLADGGEVRGFWPGVDSESIIYSAAEEAPNVNDLWRVRPFVFTDGFESGDTSEWSRAEP